MNLIFIDFENVVSHGLKGIENLDKTDCVYLFYSINTPNLPIELVNQIKLSPAKVEFIESKTGKNAMDFVISSFLGYMINEHLKKANYYIISKDKGYESVIDFWEDVNIRLAQDIASIYGAKKNKKINIRSRIGMLIKGLSKDDISKIEEIIKKGNVGTYESSFKKYFKNQGENYYIKLKPLLDEIK